MSYRIAVDVGGTFTDVVAVDGSGTVTFAKAPSTPHNQAIGTMDGISRLADQLGLDVARLLAGTERIVHGMTVATNALITRRLPRTSPSCVGRARSSATFDRAIPSSGRTSRRR